MVSKLSNKMEELEFLVRQDAEYRQLLELCIDQEDAWLEIMEALPKEHAETICQFLSACMDLAQRKIELVLNSAER